MQRRKKPFWAIKSRILKSLKIRISPKGLTHAFRPKNANLFFICFFIKTRLEIILNAFVEKKQTFFDYNNQNFSKSKKIAFFQRGSPILLIKKCQFLLYLDLVKIRLEIMLNYFEVRKETFFDYKKQNFSKSKKSHFFKRG